MAIVLERRALQIMTTVQYAKILNGMFLNEDKGIIGISQIRKTLLDLSGEPPMYIHNNLCSLQHDCQGFNHHIE
jgi:hypothetical protein